VQFRGAAGEVEGADAAPRQHGEHRSTPRSSIISVRVGPGVDVAMQAALIAAVAEVDLQRGELRWRRSTGNRLLQQGQGGVHGNPFVFNPSARARRTACQKLTALFP
jgi:hypothetical protein